MKGLIRDGKITGRISVQILGTRGLSAIAQRPWSFSHRSRAHPGDCQAAQVPRGRVRVALTPAVTDPRGPLVGDGTKTKRGPSFPLAGVRTARARMDWFGGASHGVR